MGTHCRHIAPHDVSWVSKQVGNKTMFCFHAAQNWKHLLRTQNDLKKKSETVCVSATNFASPTNVAHAGKQVNFCLCNNVSSFATALKTDQSEVTCSPFFSLPQANLTFLFFANFLTY